MSSNDTIPTLPQRLRHTAEGSMNWPLEGIDVLLREAAEEIEENERVSARWADKRPSVTDFLAAEQRIKELEAENAALRLDCSETIARNTNDYCKRIEELEAERDAIGRLIRGETDVLPVDTPLLKTFAELIRVSDESRARLAAAERALEECRAAKT